MDRQSDLSKSPEVRRVIANLLSNEDPPARYPSSAQDYKDHKSKSKPKYSFSELSARTRRRSKQRVLHVRLRNLDRNITEEDLQVHFERLWPNCLPRIYPLREQGTSGHKETAVSFSIWDGTSIESARLKLESTILASTKAEDEKRSNVEVRIFQGEQTTLISNTPFDPDFDCYFVHGLKGHPIKTFSGKPQRRDGC